MEYNRFQQQAIDSGRRRLLVSAGAGSGKTRVLVGRVLRLVADEGRKLSEFLIITFTRAAAAELKSRILKGLAALAAERPTDAHIRRQLTDSMDGVTTIDAFYSKLVREYAHVLGVGEFRVVEGAARDLIKAQALREAVESVFSSDDADVCAFVSSVPLAAAERIVTDSISRLYEAEQSQPFPEQWREETRRRYENGGEELREQLPSLRGLFKACDIFTDCFRSRKTRKNALDFSDMNRLVVRLMCDVDGEGRVCPSEVAETVGSRYAEVFIDEFQDTNRIQTLVAEMLTYKTGALFMVGDVKQSIYRFRQAEPSIYLERRCAYPTLCDDTPERADARVALADNYRSRTEVVDTVNYFFGKLFCGGAAEIEYTDDDRQRAGRTAAPDSRYNTEFAVLRLPPKSNEEAEDAAAVEAAYVAKRIEALVAGGFEVQDGDSTRPVRAGDIAVLLRSAGSAYLYEAALRFRGIAAESGGSAGLTAELAAVLSLLSVIDNPYHDVPLIGALRSPLFGFTADELAAMRVGGSRDFYANLTAAAESNERAAAFLERVDDFRSASLRMPLDRLLLYIYEKTGAYGLYSALPSGAERRKMLDVLYSHARRYSAIPAATLRGFVEYAYTLVDSGKFAEAAVPSGDAVKIMTVHKSKGLEFPIVFLGGLSKKFNLRDCYTDLLVHPALGVGMKCYDPKRRIRYPSDLWQSISDKLKSEALAEELRIMYVAMTRAREKLFVTCTVKRLDKLADPAVVDDEFVRAAYTQSGWVLPLLRQHQSAQVLRADSGSVGIDPEGCGTFEVVLHDVKDENETLPLLPSEVEEGASSLPAKPAEAPAAELSAVNEQLYELAVDAFEWRYPAPALAAVPSKLTATAIKGLRPVYEEEEEVTDGVIDAPSEISAPPGQRLLPPPRRPRFVSSALTPTERGTAIHAAMQFCEFSVCADEPSARLEVERLREAGFLTGRQADAALCEAEKLAVFANSDLCRRMFAADKVYREFRFSLLEDASRYFEGVGDGEEVLMQGVVDMFFIEEGKIVVCDFKSDRVSRQTQAARAAEYAPQLDAYARALGRVFALPVRERLVYFMATGESVAV